MLAESAKSFLCRVYAVELLRFAAVGAVLILVIFTLEQMIHG